MRLNIKVESILFESKIYDEISTFKFSGLVLGSVPKKNKVEFYTAL